MPAGLDVRATLIHPEFMRGLALERLGVALDVIDSGHLPASADRKSSCGAWAYRRAPWHRLAHAHQRARPGPSL